MVKVAPLAHSTPLTVVIPQIGVTVNSIVGHLDLVVVSLHGEINVTLKLLDVQVI